MKRQYFVYIMTNVHNTVLYTGITNNLRKRARDHQRGYGGGFTSRYKCVKLVYFEVWPKAWLAITREKQIKAGSRRKKIDLIEAMNPAWKDLSQELASSIEFASSLGNAPRNDAPL